jgi:hypothetical protein
MLLQQGDAEGAERLRGTQKTTTALAVSASFCVFCAFCVSLVHHDKPEINRTAGQAPRSGALVKTFTAKTLRREGTTLRGECRFDPFHATAAARRTPELRKPGRNGCMVE